MTFSKRITRASLRATPSGSGIAGPGVVRAVVGLTHSPPATARCALPSIVRFRSPTTALALLAPLLVPVALALPSSSAPDPVSQAAAEPASEPTRGLRLVGGEPEELLTRAASGRAAVRLAGDDFAAAAALNGMAPEALRSLLLTDPTTNLDETGKLFYRDTLAGHSPSAERVSPAPYPTSQTFALESKPGSQRTIYLDFNGATVSGTAWNGSRADEIPDGDVPGFSLDSNVTQFNDAEHATIQEVWQRVAEDYAPFDVNVTTKQPTTAQIVRTGNGDLVFGTTTVITADVAARDALCGDPSCTGIAYTDVFDIPDAQYHSFYQPAWAFTATYDDVQAISETISHEVGHNFGLVHDGKGQSEPYYGGHGNWTPIMGSGFGPVTQWSNAAYTGGTNLDDEGNPGALQDDVALIAENGAPYRADEVGGTVATAGTALPAGVAIIGRRNDVDVYRLGTCTGSVTVTAGTAPSSPNLDIRLALLSAVGTDGVEVAFADPVSGRGDGQSASGMGASLTYSATGQVLYVAVDGVGNGTVNTGYDDYGSLGQYTLTASGCSAGPTPTASPTATASPTVTPTATPTVTPTPSPTVTTSPTVSPTSTTTPEPEVTVPSAPTLVSAKSGTRGRPYTVKLAWAAPADDGGSALTGYVVEATKVRSDGSYGGVLRSDLLKPSQLRGEFRIARGYWAFRLVAVNDEGESLPSAYSRATQAR